MSPEFRAGERVPRTPNPPSKARRALDALTPRRLRAPIAHTTYAGMCFGAEGVKGEPICDGPDVRLVLVKTPQGEQCTTEWCAECRRDAELQGYTVLFIPILDQPEGCE